MGTATRSRDLGSPKLRGIVSPGTFASDDERYRWLNDVIAVGEGLTDFETLRLRLRYYACVSEVRPSDMA